MFIATDLVASYQVDTQQKFVTWFPCHRRLKGIPDLLRVRTQHDEFAAETVATECVRRLVRRERTLGMSGAHDRE
jgi:hypothetical protein